MFRELAERLPDMLLAGEPQYLRSNFIGGIKHMPVAVHADAVDEYPADGPLGVGRHRRHGGYGHR